MQTVFHVSFSLFLSAPTHLFTKLPEHPSSQNASRAAYKQDFLDLATWLQEFLFRLVVLICQACSRLLKLLTCIDYQNAIKQISPLTLASLNFQISPLILALIMFQRPKLYETIRALYFGLTRKPALAV